MQAEQIAKTLGNAKKANGQWVASCPVPSHGKGNGDKNPSLSIHIGDDGKPLFHCHGGCSQEEVFNTIKDRNLLPELTERPDPLANIKPIPKVEFQQEWIYTDEDRQPVFVKQRLKVGESGKTYRLYKIDEHGRKQSSLADARIVPYNLPALLDAKTAGRNIFLVEGEKAADAIKSIGMIATTAHTGAGSWPQAITEYFAGAQVIILPDNDVAGWGYAYKAAEAILPIVKSLKVVDLGLQGQGDDAYEFIEEGGSRDKLVALVKAASIITSVDQLTMPERLNPVLNSIASAVQQVTAPTEDIAKEFETAPKDSPPPKPAKQIAIEHWDSIQDEPVKWLIEGVIPVGAFTALYGPPGSFKSFIALDIAEAIATGRSWMGNGVSEPGAVLYIAGEGFGGVGARIKAIKQHHQTPAGAPIYVIRHQLNLRSSVEDFNALMVAIETLVMETGINFKLIVIDTLARAFGGGDENSASDMMQFVVTCGRIQQIVQGAALMILHHSGKDQSRGMRGSSALLGAVDTELELIRFEDSMKGIIRTAKQKDGEDGTRYGFEMVKVELAAPAGSLQIGDPVTSLAVQASDSAKTDHAKMTEKKPPANKDGGKWQPYELPALYRAIKNKGFNDVIDGVSLKVVNIDDWKEELKLQASAYDATKTQINNAIWTAKGRLKTKNLGGHHDKVAWLNQDVLTKMASEAAYKFNS
jgi:hypothetical protein